jgi:hypothetical protein
VASEKSLLICSMVWLPTSALACWLWMALRVKSMVRPISSTMWVIVTVISWPEVRERLERLRTSCATTLKPRPSGPARAASMAALSASRLVCMAICMTSSARSCNSFMRLARASIRAIRSCLSRSASSSRPETPDMSTCTLSMSAAIGPSPPRAVPASAAASWAWRAVCPMCATRLPETPARAVNSACRSSSSAATTASKAAGPAAFAEGGAGRACERDRQRAASSTSAAVAAASTSG